MLNSLSKKFQYSYQKKNVKLFKIYRQVNLIGMGGSILGTNTIYEFLKYKIKKNDSGFCKLNLGFETDIFKVWEIKFSYDYYEETTNVNNQEKQVQFTIRKKYF